jgi:HK97 family phage portal protein
MQRAGVPVTAHTALQVDSVFTSLRVLSNAIIKMGNPRAYTEELTTDNEPYRVWLQKQPQILTNTFGSPQRGSTPLSGRVWQYDGIRRTVISMGLFGEAFWLTLLRDRMGMPLMVEVLHPAFVEATIDKVTGQPVYFYGSGVYKKKLPLEDVTWIPFMAFPGAARGLSSIEYAGVAFALALAAMEYGQRWFAQGASPSFILSTEQKLGQEEVERIARKFLIEHSGLNSAHLPLVLDSGIKAEKVSSTPDEAQYLKTLDYARSVVAAWFGLPSHLVGGSNDRGNVWGRTVAEQGMQMIDYSLSGYIVPLNEAFSSMLPETQFAALDDSLISRADPDSMAKLIMAKRTVGVETKNEIRVHDLKRPPKPGGDELLDPLNSNASPPVGGLFAEEGADELGIPKPTPEPPDNADD